ncbi:zinc ribbon domain-containing protein [Chloroflexota bacterium]
MPIYEFQCNECKRKSSFLQRSVSASLSPVCPGCGSSDLVRCVSKFAYHKSGATILEEAGDPSLAHENPDYYKDPRVIGRWAEKRLADMGVDMNSDEYKDTFAGVRETIDAAREGELPSSLTDI